MEALHGQPHLLLDVLELRLEVPDIKTFNYLGLEIKPYTYVFIHLIFSKIFSSDLLCCDLSLLVNFDIFLKKIHKSQYFVLFSLQLVGN